MAGVAVEVTVMLPVLDDGFRGKEDEFRGDEGAIAGETSRESAKWLEKGLFFPVRAGWCSCCGQCRAWLCLHSLSCPMSSLHLGFGALMRSWGCSLLFLAHRPWPQLSEGAMQGGHLLTRYPRSAQVPHPAHVSTGLVAHTSSQVSGCRIFSHLSLCTAGKGTGSLSCLLQLDVAGHLPAVQAMLSLGKRLVPISQRGGMMLWQVCFGFFFDCRRIVLTRVVLK